MENTENPNKKEELNNVNNELEENSNSINVNENASDNSNAVVSENANGGEPSAEEIIDVVAENIEKDSSLLVNDEVVNLDIANVVTKRKNAKSKKGKKKTQKKTIKNVESESNENKENVENVENNSSNNNEENVAEAAVVAEEVIIENNEVQENVENVDNNVENSEAVSNENKEVVQDNIENVEESVENSEEASVETENVENPEGEEKKASGKKKKKKKKKPEVSDVEEEIIAIEEVKEGTEEVAEESAEESNEDSNNAIVEVKEKHNVRKVIFIILGILVFAGITCLGIAYYDIKNTKIEFNLNGEDVVIEAGQAQYEESGFIATRNGKDIKEEVKVASNVNDKVIGEYKVEYNLKIDILGYDHTLIRNVTVHDTTPPELNVEAEDEFVAYIGDEFNVPAYSASDSYDGDLTDKVEVDNQVDNTTPGTYTITYTVSDSSNNTTSKAITVKVEKKKNPKIVVSISEQTLYYYEYDEVVLTSSVVTGVNNQTPTGTFKILNKARNVDLKGDDYVSHVQYWLAFKGNSYGFHDASWRSSFGGSIYIRNGSHGCVNMPYSKVQQLYNMVSVGTPVYIYR